MNYHSLHISDIFENILKDLNQHKHGNAGNLK